jgi:alcohol dehydrogenase (NADP+)
MKLLTFKNGDQMPIFGLGTWKSAPNEAFEAVLEAVKAGYRHIDCAHIYKNEKEVGEALSKVFKEGWVKREELWITSKLWNDSHEEQEVLPALKRTLQNLQLDYLDLYLIHWPIALKKGVDFPKGKEDFSSPSEAPLSNTWGAMEQVADMGLTRHIGLSNFNSKKINEILSYAKIRPEVNQVELHPFLPQNELLTFCRANDIFVTGYAPLGSSYRVINKEVDFPILLENEIIQKIASKHDATPAQVAISWGISRGTAVIPKSVKKHRILENLAATRLQLDAEDMEKINSLEGPFRFTTGKAWFMEGSPYKPDDVWEG